MTALTRRRVLRGILNGAAVSVGLPLLNCFLNENGTAWANGTPLPVRFSTWGWGLGMSKVIFVPQKTGADFDLPEEIACLAPVRDKINLFTNFNAFRDASPNLCHTTGWIILRSGSAPLTTIARPGETIDVTVGKKIGTTTRFPSLTVSSTGDPRDTYSYESTSSINDAEGSPLALYQTLFGVDYQDPNAKEFKPSPKIMVRQSVLSGVNEDAKKLMSEVGAEDKARIDQYFTGLREVELQLDRQLQKPEPREACRMPAAPKELKTGVDVELVAERHRLFTDLLVMAVACDQTRVLNMTYSKSFASTTKVGYEKPHHTASHEEPLDHALGYQPMVSWFLRRAFESWAYYVQAFSKVKEGDGTLLDNMLIYASTDQSFAKIHSIEGLPMFTAGRAGGKLKTGLHIDGGGTPGARLGYTAMKTLGVDISSWGTQSNNTSKEITEILT
jgi:Protein of unknown function (DUF1552)